MDFPIISQIDNVGKAIAQMVTPAPMFTGFSSQASATVAGAVMAKTGTANRFLIVTPQTASPFIKADIYDSLLKKVTALTISGVLAETLSNGAKTCTDGVFLVWSTEQSAWYLKSANTTVSKVYPLTLSGTTLTVGSPIDISATYANALMDTVAMTGDDTDLWFIDLAGNNGPRKYDLSGASFGSAQAAPTNSGYYNAASAMLYNHRFIGSSTKLWLASSTTDKGVLNVFQEFSIAGNAWTDKGVPAQCRNFYPGTCFIGVDPLSPTYVWFIQTQVADSALGPVAEPQAVRWKVSTNSAEVYCMLKAGTNAYSTLSSGDGDNGAPNVLTNASGTDPSIHCIVVDETNDNLVFCTNDTARTSAGTQKIFNIGKKWGRKTVYEYTGSGYFHGLVTTKGYINGSSSSTSMPTVSSVAYILTIDGTELPPIMMAAQSWDRAFDFNIPFNTSIKVESLGTPVNATALTNAIFVPPMTLRATLTS